MPEAESTVLGIGASCRSQCAAAKAAIGKIRNDVGQQEKAERKLEREKEILSKGKGTGKRD